MLFPEQKEREKRFRLALRMGLPVFALSAITITSLMLQYFHTIPPNFIIIAASLLGIMVYYLFYLIYQGFNERITDPITHVFTREYFSDFIEAESKKRVYTILLFSVENLYDINKEYGFINGDKVLYNIANRLNNYFEENGLNQIPIAHFKGGDFILALEGDLDRYRTLMELATIKFSHFNIEDIEVDMIGSMVDTSRSRSIEKLVERLFELQNENRKVQSVGEEDFNPEAIEHLVIEAIEQRSFSYRYQKVFENGKPVIFEMAVKMVTKEGKLIHQKRFMPVITRLGLLRKFDEIQVEVAANAVCIIESEQKIAVNVAASSLRNPLFLDYILTHVSQQNALKERLIFLMSESKYYYQDSSFNARLQAYRHAGILIALDRLGGLHSSLRYLYDLDVDMVRFEPYLGKEITHEKAEAIVEGFTQSIRRLGMKSWVKMIENESQLQLAQSLGINYFQGNYLGPIESLKEEKSNEIR